MPEFTNNAIQTVAQGQNVLFTAVPVGCPNGSVSFRLGSGVITLRGNTNQCFARYKVSFGGNIAVPPTGTAGEISLAIAISGEPEQSTTMIETPTATGAYSNVFSAVYVCVPQGCCVQIGVENTSTQSIDVQNANLIVERVA